MALIFDSDQEKAYTINCNSVITAGAGSGKTSVLTERFLWLLHNKKALVDEILTLTFTRRAAAEMYERIYRRLKVAGETHSSRELGRFDRAQISTLDSFCSQIVRNSCHLFGLPENFDFDEERVKELAEETSFNFLLSHLEDPALSELITIMGFERVQHNILSDIAVNHLHLGADFDFIDMYARQQDFLIRKSIQLLAQWENLKAQLSALEHPSKALAENKEELKRLDSLKSLLDEERYNELAQLLGGLGLNKRGGGKNREILQMKDIVDQLRETAGLLTEVGTLLANKHILKGFLSLLESFQLQYDREKRNRALLDFADLSQLAVAALLKNKALRSYYKKKFRYIMIDEFQDNNQLQKDLLYLLAEKQDLLGSAIPQARDLEEDKLFFVGDEKQSIYRFRGADVSVFKGLSRELAAQSREPAVALNTNYRSEPGLIAFFNRIFRNIMGDAVFDFEADFQELRACNRKLPLKSEIRLLYKPYLSEKEDSPFYNNQESEGFRIAQYLVEAVDKKKLQVRDEEGLRPAEFNDFALLLRSTTHQKIYERIFRLFDIPYTAVSVRSLFLEAPIYDFYQLLQLAIYPEDRLAYGALLRSPLVNISDDTLVALLSLNREPFTGIDDLNPEIEERHKLDLGRELWLLARDNADRISISALFDLLWQSSGYRYFILAEPRNHNFLEYYTYLLSFAQKADQRGENLAQFLDFLRQNLGSHEKQEEPEISENKNPGVQILTIHRAKGLEFPIVILADMGNMGVGGSPVSRAYYFLSDHGFTLNLGKKNYFAMIGEQDSRSRENAELKRLLYVALTRASHHLILSGVHHSRNRTSPNNHLNMLLHGTGSLQEPAAAREEKEDYLFSIELIDNVSREEYRSRLEEGKRLQQRPRLAELDNIYSSTTAISRSFLQRDFNVSFFNDLNFKRLPAGRGKKLPELLIDPVLKQERLDNIFGSLTHYLIEQEFLQAETASATLQLLKEQIPPEYYHQFIEQGLLLKDKFLDSELGSLARQSVIRKTEFPFVYFLDDRDVYISGQVDLYFESGNQAYIIDFKSGKKYFPGEYSAQLGLYKLALSQLTDKEIFCYLFLLRSGESISADNHIDWQVWLLQELNANRPRL
ncbi:MAG: AAA family ATPase [Spirochaeta sp.]|nr:AAA family ATPase [Spirochaeta sp.]